MNKLKVVNSPRNGLGGLEVERDKTMETLAKAQLAAEEVTHGWTVGS